LSQFKDLVVIELASVLAGPAAGQFFAELGANVIKVENLKTSGDVTRTWKSAGEKSDDRSAYFCCVNWGKQSVAVDLSQEEGRKIALGLIRQADILIASYKPGDAEKFGVDYKTVSRDNPGLIYGQITGYGSDNPRVGYDAIIQAESGFMSMNGESDGRPLKMPVALIDILASHHLKEGILLAMLEKTRTGQGGLVEVSLMDAAIASLANQATNFLVAGNVPGKQGSAHPNIAPYGDVFSTRDGTGIMLAVGTDKQFVQLCNILKISSISEDPSFANNVSRVQNRKQLTAFLANAIATFTTDELMRALHQERIPAGAIRDVGEAVATASPEILLSGDGIPGIRTYAGRGSAISPHLRPPPHLGEHTLPILQQMLKISPTDAEKLLSQGVVA
jgi:crotonobetainyl-CoA:carnitine CoA-transferase CaiB-like acyl-CoA transferase